ncbi:hypothetical protein GCM10028798_23410 [Humibacter antri]
MQSIPAILLFTAYAYFSRPPHRGGGSGIPIGEREEGGRIVKRSIVGMVLAMGAAGLFFPALVPGVAYAAPGVAASYTTVAELAAAFASAGSGPVITLSQDLDGTPADPAVAVRAGGSITLDLHGHTLRLDTTDPSNPALGVPAGTALTIEDTVGGGKLIVQSSGSGAGIGSAAGPYGNRNVGYGKIVISGAVVSATSAEGAGIGIGYQGGISGGPVIIGNGSNVTATSGLGAGIGGSYYTGGSGAITITGGSTVVATGGGIGGAADTGGAGIGGGPNGFSEPISIEDGSFVTATAQHGGAGIGGGSSGFAQAITISGSTVNATSAGGAGIGGGISGPMTTVTIDGGVVSAVGGQGAGIGGGGGAGSNWNGVTIQPGSDVTASSARGIAIGSGTGGSSAFGSLTNGGTLRIPAGNSIAIPAGASMTNSGALVVNGSVVNNGTILNSGTVEHAENVSVHNTTVSLDAAGGTAPAAPPDVFAESFHDGQIPFPTAATRTGYTFAGWFTSALGGTQVTDTTGLGNGGPATMTLFAQWSANEYTVSFDSQGGSNVAAQNVAYGADAALPTPPVLGGHTFLGWFTEPSGGSRWAFTTPITGDLTLYAQWGVGGAENSGGEGGGQASGASPSSGQGTTGTPSGGMLAATGSDVAAWPPIAVAALSLLMGVALIAGRRLRKIAARRTR